MPYYGDPTADMQRLIGATTYINQFPTYTTSSDHTHYLGDPPPFVPGVWGPAPARPEPAPQPKKEKKEHMRGLFEVFIVNPETGEYTEQRFVADDESKARLKAARGLPEDTDLDDVDIIVRRIGDVRPKRRVKEVRLVKD